MTETAFQPDAFQNDAFQIVSVPATATQGHIHGPQPYFVVADIEDEQRRLDRRTAAEKRRERAEERKRRRMREEVAAKVAQMLADTRARKAEEDWLLDLIDDGEYVKRAA